MLLNQTTESLIAQLQRLRQHADHNRRFGSTKKDSIRRPYFRNQPPEVREEAWKQFYLLCSKHKSKIEANPAYIRALYPTAVSLALDKLGLRKKLGKQGFHRMREINRIKVDLGIRDKNPSRRYIPRRKSAAPSSSVQELNVPEI